MKGERMLKERIIDSIRGIIDSDFGFDVYIAINEGENTVLKKFYLEEGNPAKDKLGYKTRIRESIKKAIIEKFFLDDAQYSPIETIANNQNVFYVIPQNKDYYPFVFLEEDDDKLNRFSLIDKEKASAILFKFTIQREGRVKQLWAYQNISPTTLPNKKGRFLQFINKNESFDVFTETKQQMFVITQNINLLILKSDYNENGSEFGEIITDNLKLMESRFELEGFIRVFAHKSIKTIIDMGIIKNVSKLTDYINRSDKRYAKKILQINKYPVVSMNKGELIEKINTVDLWKDKFHVKDGSIELKSYNDVEALIDLFIERFTKSEITGQQYDTSVKDVLKMPKNKTTNPSISDKAKS